MPTYDYRCTKCKHVFELFHSITEDKPKRCPRCKGLAKRIPSPGGGLIFKGSGFYITDYRSKSYQDRAKQDTSSGSESTSGGEKSSGEKSSADKKGGAGKKRGGGAKPAKGGASSGSDA